MSNRLIAAAFAAYAMIFLFGVWFSAQLPHVAAHHWLAVATGNCCLAVVCIIVSLWSFQRIVNRGIR
jgi:hypothetical protein